jgi:hypothetical protein
LRSRLGLALTAMRDNDVAAESQGVDVGRIKLLVYVLAAFGTGCAGALYFLNALRISPDAAFGMDWIPLLFFTVIIGGIGTIEGPISARCCISRFAKLFADYGAWYLIALGLLAIVVMIRFPRGIYGELAARFGWRFFPDPAHSAPIHRSSPCRIPSIAASLTSDVIETGANAPSARCARSTRKLVEHLHAFVRDVELTPDEWLAGIRFLTATGQKCDDVRQEFILLSDTLGVSMLVDALANRERARVPSRPFSARSSRRTRRTSTAARASRTPGRAFRSTSPAAFAARR